MRTVLKNTGILLLIALVAVAALAFVYELTKAPIERAQQQQKADAYGAVFPDAAAFDTLPDEAAVLSAFNATRTDGSSVEEILIARDAAGQTIGFVAAAASDKGYGGTIRIALGIDKAGAVAGYAVLSHSESPGFGANCENEDVRQQFIGITSADQIDGITGATYTTQALRAATQAALALTAQLGEEIG